AASVLKLKTKLAAMLSGGSSESWSVTWAAKTVTVQVSAAAKSTLGLIVKAEGPPVTTVSATLRVPLVVQTIWNQLPVTLTGSLKVMSMFIFVFWLAAPLVGLVVETFGAASVVVKLKTKSVVMLSGGSFTS